MLFVSCLGIAHATITVGTCKSAKNPYLTISSAITASPANGLIQVCPGTYPEQLVITKPLSITGLTVAGQPGVTIKSPAGGVSSNVGGYSLVTIDNAQGPVNLKNLFIGGVVANLGNVPGQYSQFCGYIIPSALVGLTYVNSPGTIRNVNISGVYLPSDAIYRPEIGLEPNCGVGIAISNPPSQVVTVRNSSITNVGYAGILASGNVITDFNIISVTGGYYSTGISGSGKVTRNTITLGVARTGSVGITGAALVKGNTIQYADAGITNSTQVTDNVLLNNHTGIVGNDASLNLIYAPPTYLRTDSEECIQAPSFPLCTVPTVGINLQCLDGSLVRENGILNVGIGVANVESDASFSPTNVISGVTTTSTGCPQ